MRHDLTCPSHLTYRAETRNPQSEQVGRVCIFYIVPRLPHALARLSLTQPLDTSALAVGKHQKQTEIPTTLAEQLLELSC